MSNALAETDMTTKNTQGDTQDWHRADIVAAVKKTGWSLSALSLHLGYARTTLSCTLDRHWKKGEHIIAEVIGVPPQTIWPSRYAAKHKTPVRKTIVSAYRKNKQAASEPPVQADRKDA